MILIDNKIPILKRGNILDSNILNNIQDSPYDYLKLLYLDYSNGIISGIKLYAKEYKLIIGEGIVKWNNFYYKITNKIEIDIPFEDGDYIFKIKFHPSKSIEIEKYTLYQMEIFHTFDIKEKEDEMEIVRIKRREGAIIRNITIFTGINEEYNIINEITKAQSTSTGKSFPDNLLKLYAMEIFEKKEFDQIDEYFCHSIINSQITRESLRQYIKHKLQSDINEKGNSDNINIYKLLEKIFKKMKNSRLKEKMKKIENNLLIVE
ncbi:MAG: hypothetical protein LBT66_02160 [Methanobrevibacter sp.]|nr:hypothetical protein [Candidatus Methanovirga meridionalis]